MKIWSSEQLSALGADNRELFKQVRPYAGADLGAWLSVIELSIKWRIDELERTLRELIKGAKTEAR